MYSQNSHVIYRIHELRVAYVYPYTVQYQHYVYVGAQLCKRGLLQVLREAFDSGHAICSGIWTLPLPRTFPRPRQFPHPFYMV